MKKITLFISLMGLVLMASAQSNVFTVEGETFQEGNLTLYRYHALSPVLTMDTVGRSAAYRTLLSDIVEKHRCRLQKKLDTESTGHQANVDTLCAQQTMELEDELADVSYLCEEGANEHLTIFFSQRMERELSRTQSKANAMPRLFKDGDYGSYSGIGYMVGINENFLGKGFNLALPATSFDLAIYLREGFGYFYCDANWGIGSARPRWDEGVNWDVNERLVFAEGFVGLGFDCVARDRNNMRAYVGWGYREIGWDTYNYAHHVTQVGMMYEYHFKNKVSLRPGVKHIEDKELKSQSIYIKLETVTTPAFEWNKFTSTTLGIGCNFDYSALRAK